MKKYLILILLFLAVSAYAETIPDKPNRYFNDNVGLVTAEQASQFNEVLAQFERETSNQFVVAIYPYMDTESDAADYTQRIAQSWNVGQKDKRNGLVLFIFMKTYTGKGRIQAQVGYGLEGAIPDVTAFRITQKMGSYFKNKDYYNGIDSGINSFMAAAKNEHTGTGLTVAETPIDFSGIISFFYWLLLITLLASPFSFYFYKKHKARVAKEKRLAAEREARCIALREKIRRKIEERDALKQKEWEVFEERDSFSTKR